MSKNKSKSFTVNNKTYVDGIDYHSERDEHLIRAHGYDNLNFNPSTPPIYR